MLIQLYGKVEGLDSNKHSLKDPIFYLIEIITICLYKLSSGIREHTFIERKCYFNQQFNNKNRIYKTRDMGCLSLDHC